MIYGQMNPEVMAAMRGRLGLGMGIRNAGPASYQAPQFPGGMNQYTPQPQLPGQWGQMPQNTGVVPPHIGNPWGNAAITGEFVPSDGGMIGGFKPGATLPPPTPIQGPAYLPMPTPIGGPRSEIQPIPVGYLPSENPIQVPRGGGGASIPAENPVQAPGGMGGQSQRQLGPRFKFWY